MGYTEWFEKHANKHKRIVTRLRKQNKTKQEIIEYFRFENMVQNENHFCPLYAKNKKCHDMKNLNCYMCACPNFRFSDSGIEKQQEKTKYSFCEIDSKDGRAGVYGDAIHQDCSKCSVPHHESYIEKHFSYDWREMMHKCMVK